MNCDIAKGARCGEVAAARRRCRSTDLREGHAFRAELAVRVSCRCAGLSDCRVNPLLRNVTEVGDSVRECPLLSKEQADRNQDADDGPRNAHVQNWRRMLEAIMRGQANSQ